MKKSLKIKKSMVIFFLVIFSITSLTSIFAQETKNDNEIVKHVTMELILANFEKALCSNNHGLRMGAVDLVGRSNISHFEDHLIELIEEEESYKDKERIALSLFQFGSLKSINALRDIKENSDDKELKEFCAELLQKFEEYKKVRNEYFEGISVSLLETE